MQDIQFGKYISPHLVKYNERITVNNVEITDKEISDILEKVAKKVEEYNKEHNTPVKEFEVVTTLALIYFAEKNCDFVVLETGLRRYRRLYKYCRWDGINNYRYWA